MKKQFISFFTFSRIERQGLIALITLLLLLIATRLSMHWFVHAALPVVPDSTVQRQWNAYKKHEVLAAWHRDSLQQIRDLKGSGKKRPTMVSDSTSKVYINFDDSLKITQIRQFNSKIVRAILWRRKYHGNFTDLKQLCQYCYVPEGDLTKIKNRISFGKPPFSVKNHGSATQYK